MGILLLKEQLLLLKFGALKKQFDVEFNKCWCEFIQNCDKDMSKAKQLNIGNHTRPFLVYLGVTTNCNFDDLSILADTAQLAVSIEAIHKASVIIDDIIDGDTLRRGEKCMHYEFGEYETIFFAVCMLSLGIQRINNILSLKGIKSLHTNIINLVCDTIYNMCHGAIREISASVQNQTNLQYIKDIINSETIKLIENSLYIGFLYSESQNDEAGTILRDMGKKCGYIFQVMNDLEAFCNPQHTLEYKGNINSDFLRSRKNIILPYLYNSCGKSDKKKLLALLGGDELCFQEAKSLFDKYVIKEIIFKDINEIYHAIFMNLTKLNPLIKNKKWIEIFEIYLNYSRDKYQAILKI